MPLGHSLLELSHIQLKQQRRIPASETVAVACHFPEINSGDEKIYNYAVTFCVD